MSQVLCCLIYTCLSTRLAIQATLAGVLLIIMNVSHIVTVTEFYLGYHMSAITCLRPKYYILTWDHGAGTVYMTVVF